MDQFRIVQVGLGEFGSSWLEEAAFPCPGVEIAGLVTTNPQKKAWAMQLTGLPAGRIYADLSEALEKQRPDLLLNVTPPAVHFASSMEAVRRGIPVLCEKPVAQTLQEAEAFTAAVKASQVPVYISEDYRFYERMTKVRDIIASGRLGRIDHIDVRLGRHHTYVGEHLNLPHPMLMDCGVHYFDLMRYLTGQEAVSVYARSWAPEWSHYSHHANCFVDIVLKDQIQVCFHGGIACYGNDTAWPGSWHFDGEKGCLDLRDTTISITDDEGVHTETVTEYNSSRRNILLYVMKELQSNAGAVPNIYDNMKTYYLMDAAVRSAESGMVIRL